MGYQLMYNDYYLYECRNLHLHNIGGRNFQRQEHKRF